MGDTKLDTTIRARRIDLAQIELKRAGGALVGTIKSPLLHQYVQNLVAQRIAASSSLAAINLQTVVSAPGIFPEMRTYRALDTGIFRDMCGTAQMTGEDGIFHIIRPSNSADTVLGRQEPTMLSILPLCGPHIETGAPFRISGMLTTRQMRLMVKGWQGFVENVHKEHAVPVIVGVKMITEEYYLPLAEIETVREVPTNA